MRRNIAGVGVVIPDESRAPDRAGWEPRTLGESTMAERTLRGSRMVSHSLETDDHVVPSERQITAYVCPQGHRTELPFSIEAEIPPTWECRCGEEARLVDGPEPEAKQVKHVPPTGTCCWSVAPSPSSRSSSRSA